MWSTGKIGGCNQATPGCPKTFLRLGWPHVSPERCQPAGPLCCRPGQYLVHSADRGYNAIAFDHAANVWVSQVSRPSPDAWKACHRGLGASTRPALSAAHACRPRGRPAQAQAPGSNRWSNLRINLWSNLPPPAAAGQVTILNSENALTMHWVDHGSVLGERSTRLACPPAPALASHRWLLQHPLCCAAPCACVSLPVGRRPASALLSAPNSSQLSRGVASVLRFCDACRGAPACRATGAWLRSAAPCCICRCDRECDPKLCREGRCVAAAGPPCCLAGDEPGCPGAEVGGRRKG